MADTLQLPTTKTATVKICSLSSMVPSSWQNPRLTGRIAELDGIRGLAILLVLVWHYLTWHSGGRLMDTVGYTWIAAFYASLLSIVVVNPGHTVQRIFRNRALVRLGILAYAVYLIHQGINSLYHWAFFAAVPDIHSLATAGVTALALVTSVIIAEVSWRFMEKPLIRLAHTRYHYVAPV